MKPSLRVTWVSNGKIKWTFNAFNRVLCGRHVYSFIFDTFDSTFRTQMAGTRNLQHAAFHLHFMQCTQAIEIYISTASFRFRMWQWCGTGSRASNGAAAREHTPMLCQRNVEFQLFYWVNSGCVQHPITSTSLPRPALRIRFIHVWLHFRCRLLLLNDSIFAMRWKTPMRQRQKVYLGSIIACCIESKKKSGFFTSLSNKSHSTYLVCAIIVKRTYAENYYRHSHTHTRQKIIFYASANIILYFCYYYCKTRSQRNAHKKRHFHIEKLWMTQLKSNKILSECYLSSQPKWDFESISSVPLPILFLSLFVVRSNTAQFLAISSVQLSKGIFRLNSQFSPFVLWFMERICMRRMGCVCSHNILWSRNYCRRIDAMQV